jgi:predicted Zn finger-like uncharacterized protein
VFTQCSKCETVFRVSASALRAAGGQVRCGHCGEVFNALARLAEDATQYPRGDSSLAMEVRVDDILRSGHAAAPEPSMAAHGARVAADAEVSYDANVSPGAEVSYDANVSPGAEVSQLHVLEPPDNSLISEASLEFTLPPGELDRIFIETTPSVLKLLAAEGQRKEPASSKPAPTPAALGTAAANSGAYSAAHTAAPWTRTGIAAGEGSGATDVESGAAPEPSPTSAAGSASADSSESEISDTALQEFLASYRRAPQPPLAEPRRGVPNFAWVAAAILLALLLAVQVLLANRDWWAARVPLLGEVVSPAPNLSAYQLRQWGVSGDPDAAGTLRLRASIMNTGTQLQPYPLLRVTLANRYGAPIARREFEPAEYLGKAAPHMLGLGERADATLDILDPGKEAEGFEIDVCLRGAVRKIFCAGDAVAQTQ